MTAPRRLPAALVLALIPALAHAADGPALVIDAGRPGAAIAPTMWGVFFEDINFGADGGLVAEGIKNGAFEFPDALMGWRLEGTGGRVEVRADAPAVAAGRRTARLTVDAPAGSVALVNEGFRGIGVREGKRYRASLRARAVDGALDRLRAELVAPGGRVLAGADLGPLLAWGEHAVELVPTATEAKATFRLVGTGRGVIELDLVSLQPVPPYYRPGLSHLRSDLVGLLDDLRPGFVRFPGGCIVEGKTLANRYAWKETIGPIESRRLQINRWNDEFKHRPTPDYFQSFALGFFEYFALSEALGAEPLPILNCGMACQFNTGELAPLDQLGPYVQDALDLIEFATGPADSPWGARRAAMGHPAPFELNYLGIGNEQWGPQYIERYVPIARAVKAKYPHVQIIASAGPAPADERFRYLWEQFRTLRPDIVDEHCYAAPSWFLDNTRRYDEYDRDGPKIFMGEYAAQSDRTTSPNNRNTWACALAEAAYMTGLERNADVVVMAAYAPLLAHADAWQWTPDLIWFDNLRAYGTPSYQVQRLFARNRGDRILPAKLSGVPAAPNGQPRVYATAAREDATGEAILKLVNATDAPQVVHVSIDGIKAGPRVASLTTLTATPDAVNSFEQPQAVAPRMRQVTLDAPTFPLELPAHAVVVARVPLR